MAGGGSTIGGAWSAWSAGSGGEGGSAGVTVSGAPLDARPTIRRRLGFGLVNEALRRLVVGPLVAIQIRPSVDELTDDRIGRVPYFVDRSHLSDLSVVE